MADIDLAFIAQQLDRVIERLGAVEDQMSVTTAMVRRLDATVGGLTDEVRALSRQLERIDHRVRALET
jgi:archaellum component FlaC